MDKLTDILRLLRSGAKGTIDFGTDLAGSVLDKAVSNPKLTAAFAAGAGLYIDPTWVVAASKLITRIGGFVGTIGKAMGG